MSDDYEDPSGSTMAFRAYMNRQQEQQAEAPAKSKMPLIIGGVAAALVVVAVVLFIALG